MPSICIPITSRAAYGRLYWVLQAINRHEDLSLHVIPACSALVDRYGDVSKSLESRFPVSGVCRSLVMGDKPVTMAQTTGLLIQELAPMLEEIEPDIVLCHADRYETLGVALTASYMNIPVAHTQGGESTGSIDDRVRWAVTNLSSLHFPATSRAGDFIDHSEHNESKEIYVTGCPSLDYFNNELPSLYNIEINKRGSGHTIDFDEPYLLVSYHSVTTEYDKPDDIRILLRAVQQYQCIWLLPNCDAGGERIAKTLRQEADKNGARIRFLSHLPPQDFYSVMAGATCCVGNSSAFIREGSYIGVPAVNIGTRQQYRERADNVIDCDMSLRDITRAILRQINHGPYKRSTLYGDGNASQQITSHLADFV